MCPDWAHFFCLAEQAHSVGMHSLGYTFSVGAPEKKQKNKNLRAPICAILPPAIQRRDSIALSTTSSRQGQTQRTRRYTPPSA